MDLDLDGSIAPSDAGARLRSAPPGLTAAADSVVIRVHGAADPEWSHEVGLALRQCLELLRVSPDLFLIQLPLGNTPRLVAVASVATPDAHLALLGRCRHIELATMLQQNNGVWKPTDYHFRLPSGAHGNCFVRVADSIRTPRDALALAQWTAPFVREGTGILADSASLVGLTAAIDRMAARGGIELGPIVSLEEYPKNRLDTMKAVRDVDRGSSVLAILSVHSTGSLLDRMLDALSQVATGDWSLQILVDKAGHYGGETLRLPSQEGAIERTNFWTRLGEDPDVPSEDCRSCRQGPGRLVRIDPRTFDGMVLPEPELLTPSAVWAFGHRRFWELVDESDAVTVEAASDVSNLHPRYGTDKFMSVKVSFADMLSSVAAADLISATCHRLRELCAEEKLAVGYDLILVDEREAELEGFSSLLAAIKEELSIPGVVTYSPEGGLSDQHPVVEAHRLLIFQLGVVSGLSLQQALYQVQQARRGGGRYEVDALVLHLRPEDGRVRETLENSVARRLACAWESYFPEDRHPLQEELEILAPLHLDDAASHVRGFQEDRLAICTGFSSDAQLLWGAGPHNGPSATRLTPMSFFGEHLRVRAAFAAIGAAVHHSRIHADTPRSAPHWRMFEMPAICRSYYDPVILSCILRWLRAPEIWWGNDSRVTELTLVNILRRTRGDELRILVSELLLAAAQGKVPSPMKALLLAEGEKASRHVGVPDDASIRLGMACLERSID